MKNPGFIVAIFCLALVAAGEMAAAEQMRSGSWKVVTKKDAPKCDAEAKANRGWVPIEKKDGKALITIYPPTGDVGEPAKFIILFGNPDAGAWYTDEEEIEEWWECRGEDQWGWFIEAAPDIRYIVDPNESGRYKVWVCMETTAGKRYPWIGASPLITTISDQELAKVHPSSITLPKDYKWDGGKSSHPGLPKVSGLGKGETRVVTKDKAPVFDGLLYAFEGWVWDPVSVKSGPCLISWPKHAADPVGGEVARYLVYFGDATKGADWYPDPQATKAWFEGRGEGQWGWYLECGPDVTEIVDTNSGTGYLAYVAVEYASGKRVPLYGEMNATRKRYREGMELTKTAYTLPKDYKLGDSPTPTPTPVVSDPDKPLWQNLGGAKRTTGELKAGHYRVLNKADVPEWKGELWSSSKWSGTWIARRASLVTWPGVKDDGDTRAVKFILLFSKEFKNSPDWFRDPQKVKAWMECKGDNQTDWLIECAPDVTQFLDHNNHLSYYVWVIVEFSDGTRSPWFRDGFSGGFPTNETYDSSRANKVQETCLKLYEDHEWAGQIQRESDLKPGEWRIVSKAAAQQWKGQIWTADRFNGKNKSPGRQDMFSWPTCTPDVFGNKPVKFILYFGRRDTQTKWHQKADCVQKWFSLQGQAKEDGAQYDWCIECATDVTQLVDTLKDNDYNFWVVVEYSNGKRGPFHGDNFPAQQIYDAAKVQKNHIRIGVTEAVPKK